MTRTPIRFVDLQTQYRSIKTDIDAAIHEVLDRGDFILGEAVTTFERSFATYCEADQCIGVGSGLDALTLALRGLGVTCGDEVMIPANTFIATALSVLELGATPVLVEYEPATYNIDPARIERAITEKTKAIVPVHMYGHPADMDPIVSIARAHGLLVVEDAAQAHGARYHGRRCGSLADAAAFSFYPGKNLGAYGDGGAVVTSDENLAAWLRKARNYGSTTKYKHDIPGTNSRLDSIQAAVLNVKLPYLDQWNELRRASASAYHELLWDSAIVLPTRAANVQPVFHLYVVETADRDSLHAALNDAGVQSGVHYPTPIHLQRACDGRCVIPEDLTQTETAATRLLSLPMHPELSLDDIERVAGIVRKHTTIARVPRCAPRTHDEAANPQPDAVNRLVHRHA